MVGSICQRRRRMKANMGGLPVTRVTARLHRRKRRNDNAKSGRRCHKNRGRPPAPAQKRGKPFGKPAIAALPTHVFTKNHFAGMVTGHPSGRPLRPRRQGYLPQKSDTFPIAVRMYRQLFPGFVRCGESNSLDVMLNTRRGHFRSEMLAVMTGAYGATQQNHSHAYDSNRQNVVFFPETANFPH